MSEIINVLSEILQHNVGELYLYHDLASTPENMNSGVYKQQRHRPACASAQSGQRLYYSLFGKYGYLDFLLLFLLFISETCTL